MWDGREVVAGETVLQELATQASDATVIHAQGKPLTDAQRSSVAEFIVGLASAETFDRTAGHLHEDGARGGPEEILPSIFALMMASSLRSRRRTSTRRSPRHPSGNRYR
jgi:hypothetical protein